MMTPQSKIEQQLDKLYRDQTYWQNKAEEAIQQKNYHSIASLNCAIINGIIQGLQFALSGKPLHCVYHDNGNAYALSIEEVK